MKKNSIDAVVAFFELLPATRSLTTAEVASYFEIPKSTVANALIIAARTGRLRVSTLGRQKLYAKLPDGQEAPEEKDPYHWVRNRIPPEQWHEGVTWK